MTEKMDITDKKKSNFKDRVGFLFVLDSFKIHNFLVF